MRPRPSGEAPPNPRPSRSGPALSADRLRGAARLAPPPPSAQAGGVAGEGRDVWGGGGPDDGIRARRVEARSLTAPRGTVLPPKQVGVGPGGVEVEDEVRGEARARPLPAQAWAGWRWESHLGSSDQARGAPILAYQPPGGPFLGWQEHLLP